MAPEVIAVSGNTQDGYNIKVNENYKNTIEIDNFIRPIYGV